MTSPSIDCPVFVAGHRGMVGGAILKRLQALGYSNLLTRSRAELDLADSRAVRNFFDEHRPELVFLCAAKVGGILANATTPADFILQNLVIQNNVLTAAHDFGVQRLAFMGSSCIYPRDCPQPIREEYLLSGPLEPTNRPYAVAKIAGVESCWALNRQFGREYLALMPSNLYGPGDNYDLETSHVLPALLRKVHQAHLGGASSVQAWGTGRPRREFLWSGDLAEAAVHVATRPSCELAPLLSSDGPPLLNVGVGDDISIAELVQLICTALGFQGAISWDSSRPDGVPRKLLEVSRIKALGWSPRTSLAEGIKLAHEDFLLKACHEGS